MVRALAFAWLVAGCEERRSGALPDRPRPSPVVRPQVAVADAVELTRGIATFRGDVLVACAEATVAHPRTGIPSGITAEELALLLADDGVVAGHGGQSLLGGTPDRTQLTAQFREMMFAVPPARLGALADTQTAIRERLDPVALKARDAVRVERCELAARTPFATCEIDERASDLRWSVSIRHFDRAATHDRDAAMKHCLAIRGAWRPR
jgi:hypothetical protein